MKIRRSLILRSTAVVIPLLLAAGYVAKAAAEAKQDETDVYEAWREKPDEPFSDGEANFRKVLEVLKANYVDAGLTDDDFYRAATAGLLSEVDPAQRPWNKLLTPTEYRELMTEVSGELVGVGLQLAFDAASGMGSIQAVIPGTTAATAGLQAGDDVLQVDGRSFKGKQLRDMVYAIRGKAGTSVTLTMLRDAKVFDVKLARAAVPWVEAAATMMDDQTALLTIHEFAKHTPEKIRDGLTQVAQKSPSGLVVDLRGCAGGLFEAALASASLLLPDGATVVSVRHRDGNDAVKKASGGPILKDLPVTVLINGETASGCEVLAAALKQDLGATLVGSKTFGKWSMQDLDVLPNHYAAKYTIGKLYPPSGDDLSGKGLLPDVPVSADPAALARLRQAPISERLGGDPQLQTARSLLESR